MKDNYSTRDYDEFIRKSTHGSRSHRVQKSQYVPRERYNKLIQEANLKLKRWMIIALATGVIGFTGGYVANDVIHEGIPNVVENFQVSREVTQNAREFRSQYIINNTYRSETDPSRYYWYDYAQIYKGLLNFGDGDYDKKELRLEGHGAAQDGEEQKGLPFRGQRRNRQGQREHRHRPGGRGNRADHHQQAGPERCGEVPPAGGPARQPHRADALRQERGRGQADPDRGRLYPGQRHHPGRHLEIRG